MKNLRDVVGSLLLMWAMTSQARADDVTEIRALLAERDRLPALSAERQQLYTAITKEAEEAFARQKAIWTSQKEMNEGRTRLDKLATEKFGQGVFLNDAVLKIMEQQRAEVDPRSEKQPEPEVVVNGDRATATVTLTLRSGRKIPIKSQLVKRDGAWKVVFEPILQSDNNRADWEKVVAKRAAYAEALQQVAAKLERGEYGTYEAVTQAAVEVGVKHGMLATTKRAEPIKVDRAITLDLHKTLDATALGWPAGNKQGVWPMGYDTPVLLTLTLPDGETADLYTSALSVYRNTDTNRLETLSFRLHGDGHEEYLSGAEVRRFLASLGVKALDEKLEKWPPTGIDESVAVRAEFSKPPGRAMMRFRNARRETGLDDSWDVFVHMMFSGTVTKQTDGKK